MPDPFQPSLILCGGEDPVKHLKFAGKLETYRQLKGLTIAALAEKVKISADTMERLLAGQNAPNAVNLKRIELALEINFSPEDFEQYEGA
jgi:transcriptional regulator with XRE-family HTH domain